MLPPPASGSATSAAASFGRWSRRAFLFLVLVGLLPGASAPVGHFQSKDYNFRIELPPGWIRSADAGWITQFYFQGRDGKVGLKIGIGRGDGYDSLLSKFRERTRSNGGSGTYVEGTARAGDIRFVTFTGIEEGREAVIWITATKKHLYSLIAYEAKNDPELQKSLASFRLLTPLK